MAAEERTLTKQVCYALIYGAGPALVAQQAGVSEAVARTMMGEFLTKHRAVKAFIAQTKTSCRRLGYVQTLLGRRCVASSARERWPSLITHTYTRTRTGATSRASAVRFPRSGPGPSARP